MDHRGRQDGSAVEATGIVFHAPTAAGLREAVTRACRLYREPIVWRRMQSHAMRQDFTWKRSAERYLALLADLAGGHKRAPTPMRLNDTPMHLQRTGT
jgi:glycogen synthase